MNFLPNETQSLVCKVEGRKNHADATIEEGSEDEDESPRTYVLSMDYSNISVTAKTPIKVTFCTGSTEQQIRIF